MEQLTFKALFFRYYDRKIGGRDDNLFEDGYEQKRLYEALHGAGLHTGYGDHRACVPEHAADGRGTGGASGIDLAKKPLHCRTNPPAAQRLFVF